MDDLMFMLLTDKQKSEVRAKLMERVIAHIDKIEFKVAAYDLSDFLDVGELIYDSGVQDLVSEAIEKVVKDKLKGLTVSVELGQ